MPIYEYRCSECSYEFTKLVRLSEAEQKQECPGCHSQSTQKMISSFSDSFGAAGSSAGSCSSSSTGRFT